MFTRPLPIIMNPFRDKPASHRDEISARMKKDEEFVEAFKKEHPSKLAGILKARHAGDDSAKP